MAESNEKAVQKLEQDIAPIQTQVDSLVIETDEQFEEAGKILIEVKRQSKIVTARKEEITKPAYKAYKSAMDLFRAPEDQLKAVQKSLTAKLSAYQRAKDEAARKEAARLQARLDKGTMKPETVERKLDNIQTAPTAASAGLRKQTVKKVNILNWNDVPKEYFTRPSVLQAVAVEIRKDALGNASQGIAPKTIPGVEVVEETGVI